MLFYKEYSIRIPVKKGNNSSMKACATAPSDN
jgi:hypothetical protein